jgi:hypothetical protein
MERSLAEKELFALVQGPLESQRSAALAIQERGQPYLNLIAFAVTPDLKTMIPATDRYTRKNANLLVDNRSNTPEDTEHAVAVTVLVEAGEVTPEAREKFLALVVARHPQLQTFATLPNCALITVQVVIYLGVQRFAEVRELEMA